MADIEQLKSALINAHNAGDVQAAQTLAAEIKRIQSSPEQLTEDYKTKPWSEVGAEAISNIPSSAMQMGEDIATAALNPWDTAAGAAEAGVGALSMLYPDWYVKFLDDYILPDDTLQTAQQKAELIGTAMADRYGSVEGFKRTLAKDPVGVASDAAAVLSGGATAGLKAGVLPAKIASRAASAAGYIDPVSLAAKGSGTVLKGASNIPSALAGSLTGTGQDVMSELYKAGREGGAAKEAALRNMRDADVVGPEILDMAREGMEKLRQDRSNAYRSGMVDIKNDATTLDFSKIEEAFAKSVADNTFQGVPRSKSKAIALDEVGSELQAWKELGPEYWTPEGMDALKQRIGDLTDWNNKDKASNQTYLDVYNSIKNEINKQAPVYGEIMGDYSNASEQIKEIERALSLKKSGSADTAFGKLQSSLKNNVNTRFGQRGRLVGELEAASGKPLKAAIAGQSASSWLPRSIQGAFGPSAQLAYGALAGFNPWQIPLAAMQSPRLMGETAVGAGSMARALANAPGVRQASNIRVPSQFSAAARSLPVRYGAQLGGRMDRSLEEDQMTNALMGR